MQRIAVLVALSALVLVARGSITCHQSIKASLPGAEFNTEPRTRLCINSDVCVRSFGTINGKPGSFAGCVDKANVANDCGTYPACTEVNTGSGDTLNQYKTCCCKSNLCNNDSFEGETTATPATGTDNGHEDLVHRIRRAVQL